MSGPLFLGIDTHALSQPALQSALEVLAGNDVQVAQSEGDPYTPTPVISHAILCYNRSRKSALADGIVITPSHNPPDEGGFKYDPPHGGPAEAEITSWIEQRANAYLENRLAGVKRSHAVKPLYRDFRSAYIEDLAQVIDFEAIRNSRLKLGVDPLGGAGIHYWDRIAERYGLALTVVNRTIDPTFSFMTVDRDGKIRMDPSSPYAMQRLIARKDEFDLILACDTDHDRHGIVAKSVGLLPANHYLAAAMSYLFSHRPQWGHSVGIGKTVVSSQIIDRLATAMHRPLSEVPVGFKWFVEGLLQGSLGVCGEESAGGSLLRKDGSVWTTDKDGIAMCLVAVEMTARLGKDPGIVYGELTRKLGNPAYARREIAASPAARDAIKHLSAESWKAPLLAGKKVLSVLTQAPGNNAPIGGIKICAEEGWFAARPSGTEPLYKIYAESFLGEEHLDRILEEGQRFLERIL